MKTIFLDFDGVLFDSVKEAYLLARYAYYDTPIKEEINDEHYQKFRKYRYLITHSWHYYYILELIDNDTNDEFFEKKYHELIANRKLRKDSLFDKKYQEQRKYLMEYEYEFWKSLETTYPFFDTIKEIKNEYDIIILSTKNEFAIKNNLDEHDFKLNNDKIVGKEKLKKHRTKAAFIKNYMKANNVEKAIFIDDSTDNLKECKYIENLRCIQAKWGYVEPQKQSNNSLEILNLIKEL